MLKGNKGEWSEIYTLIKLLGDGKIFAADSNLNKIPNLFYPIIKILREEKQGHFEYNIGNKIVISHNNKSYPAIEIEEFREKTRFILEQIKKSTETTFTIPEVEPFLTQLQCSSLKAKSSAKTDIRIIIHDLKTNIHPELGFSIKSQLGNPSTLLNAGKTTNFIYRIHGHLTDKIINQINSIDCKGQIKARIQALYSQGCTLRYETTENSIFNSNLVIIDSFLPDILSEYILSFFSSRLTTIQDITQSVEQANPLQFDTSHHHCFYTYKIKRFLTEVAVGMMPATVWKGVYDATGGYLIVKEDGDIVSYHLYNKNEFENYLFTHTRLETASTSRHDFGKIYKEQGNYYIKLNLQIRFTK